MEFKRENHLVHQDLKPVTLVRTPARMSKTQLAQGVFSGKVAVETKGTGKEESAKNRKLDEKTEAFKIETVGHDFATKLKAARAAKNWTQKQLANAMSVHVSVVQKFESGTAAKDQVMLAKFRSKLGNFDK